LLSTFTVTNLNASGVGSLRWAILNANRNPGADTVAFGVGGTIRPGRSPLPSLTDTVNINGSTAPSFAGAPVVTIDFHGTRGFNFARGSNGSVLSSLSIVNASGAGVTLNASDVTIKGNYIGLLSDGRAVAGNHGDGIRINRSSHGNVIGNTNPVTGVSYYGAGAVSMPVTAWQGIRDADVSGQYLIAGTSDANGLLYEGPINGSGGASYSVNVPNATATSVYGPDNLGNGSLRLVGSYRNGDGHVHGFLFEGTTADLSQASDYRTIDYPGAQFTYVHSTMGGLAVGNADGPEANLPLGTGHAFLYVVPTQSILTDIAYPGSTSTTAYGIWYNGGTSYTICGGYSNLGNGGIALSHGYLVDFDAATGRFMHWTSFDAPVANDGSDVITRCEGISSVESGVYTLSADAVSRGSSGPEQGYFATVRRNTDGSFGPAVWVPLDDPGTPDLTSSNSVYGSQVVGVVGDDGQVVPFQATVNAGFQLSNVISGNRGNGIGIYGSKDNIIAMNQIGTDVSGTLQRGNRQNGILVTQGSASNVIGGQATAGNDPTAGVFARPPQGNLISGNRANGVLINDRSTQTLLSGNFVGTSASGNSALGNRLDGVAIENADGNSLLGCTFQQSPFVFYNVLSGNGGNGLRITNSNNTTVQANFMGAGANNATVVANGGDGLLVSGSSRNTQVGGVIPLGNVISGNNRNGIEVRDRASGFISFNTFAGIFAFAGAAPNVRDGILITSSGGNNLIRTCIVSGNLGNGIELGGNATGVQVTETAVGTNTDIQTAVPNLGNGILITDHAHHNAIGGFQPSVEPHVTISANDGFGIAVSGSAHDNFIFHTTIGANAQGTVALGNAQGGISLGAGTRGTTIGGSVAALQNQILFNGGDGVRLAASTRNQVAENAILSNQGYGVEASGVCTGSVIRASVIARNASGNVELSKSRGVVYIS
jgi:parallel beta-helix repeat protein